MGELHTWHIFAAVLIPTLTIFGGLYRLRTQDKDRIIAEATRQATVESRLTALEKRDAEHDGMFEKIFAVLDDIRQGLARMDQSLTDHRRECEGRRKE